MPVAYTANATINARMQAQSQRTDDIAQAVDKLDFHCHAQLGSGVGDDQINVVYRDTLSVTDETILLAAGGGFGDPFGIARDFSNVKAVMIENQATDPADIVEVTVSGFDGLANGQVIPPGGCLIVTHPGDGWAVTNPTAFNLTSSGGPGVPVDIAILGVG